MKILIAAINSKYIHANLAIYSLKSYADRALVQCSAISELPKIETAEYTINQPKARVMADIFRKAPDILFLSCYIWNRNEIENLAADIGKVMPGVEIWLGGPEVSYDAEETVRKLTLVRGVIRGEGEKAFAEIVKAYCGDKSVRDITVKTVYDELEQISDLTFREASGKIINTPESRRIDFDSVPFPYQDMNMFSNRIIYYESSRGCPFRCSYCLSSVDKRLDFRSPEIVKSELRYFIDLGIPQVKFIDRTFNCNHEHAWEIWQFIRDNDNGITNFHFEVAADLMTEEEIALLGSMRTGQVQLEIGVQSTNEKTLKEINRPMDFGRVCEVVSAIRAVNNIHLHLDLIAGLPFEDIRSFRSSFNDIFALRPHQLQLGFLKVLKGSPMDRKSESYGLRYTDAPPYEVLSTNWISYEELMGLKGVEEMVEVYYNSGQFIESVELLLGAFDDAFSFFETLACWYREHGMDMINLSRNQRYENLLEFGMAYASAGELMDALIYDFYSRENVKSRPEFFGRETVEKEYSKEFYRLEASDHRILGSPECIDADVRLLRRLTHIEKLGGRYYLFDYTQRDPMTNNARVVEL